MARGPAISLHRPRSGRAGHRGGDLHEGRYPVIQPVGRETGEGGWGFEKKPVSNAVLVLRWQHLRGRAKGATSAA